MKIAVIVASVNRATEIGQLLVQLNRQTLQPSMIILSVERQEDLPAINDPRIQIIMGPKGLTLQRNRGLERALPGNDIVVFFDDDFLPAETALAGMAALFTAHEEIAGATGLVINDGINKGGLSYETAMADLAAFKQQPAPVIVHNTATDEAYGCNMAFRAAAIGDSRFDENLPLYAWQEDVDFAGQLLAKKYRLVRTTAFAGVHRGVTKGRSPGLPLGFSQMVNPAYMVRKGTMRPAKAAKLMIKNFIANHVKSIRPEATIDRLGRARGNWLGLWHIVAGRPDPTRILQLL
jgi:glycosyltransferase involved in cell wall biosynthesis